VERLIILATLIQNIIDSAGCAASRGELFARLDQRPATAQTSRASQPVEAALELGTRAAQHGRVIPLMVLLDAWAVVCSGRSFDYLTRGRRASSPIEMSQYDAWLKNFSHHARRCFEQSYGSYFQRNIQSRADWDYLPLLMRVWPKNVGAEKNYWGWGEAYSKLLSDASARASIYSRWKSRRNQSAELWKQLWIAEPKPQHKHSDYAQSGMLSLFSTESKVKHVYEQFDHAACWMFLETEDTRLLADQSRRIHRLRQRRKQFISMPLTLSYEEQDPHHGQTALVTLCYGKYGNFKIVNHSDPRISNPPASIPPNGIKLHLLWSSGYAGITKLHHVTIDKRDSQQGRDEEAKPVAASSSEASTLQGLVALLLDDWRAALEDLPVSFYLHRDRPNLKEDLIGWGGARWKKTTAKGIPLPAHVIRRLFERRLCTTLKAELSGPERESEYDWYCACLLARDLKDFDFEQQVEQQDQPDSTIKKEAIWFGPANSLPGCVSHVIVVESPDGEGNIYKVWRSLGAQEPLELHPLPLREFEEKKNDTSFIDLRTCALDIVLDVLEARMK
jgi:hypothetical protein